MKKKIVLFFLCIYLILYVWLRKSKKKNFFLFDIVERFSFAFFIAFQRWLIRCSTFRLTDNRLLDIFGLTFFFRRFRVSFLFLHWQYPFVFRWNNFWRSWNSFFNWNNWQIFAIQSLATVRNVDFNVSQLHSDFFFLYTTCQQIATFRLLLKNVGEKIRMLFKFC